MNKPESMQNNKDIAFISDNSSYKSSDVFKVAFKWLSGISIWYKLTLGAILGALGGSTFVGFLNTYAVYNYAYQFGARIPVEGVPYLSLAVSVVSFAFLIVSFSCATFIYGILSLITKLLRGVFERIDNSWEKLREKKLASKNKKPQKNKTQNNIFNAISFLSGLITSATTTFSIVTFTNIELPHPILVVSICLLAIILSILSIYRNLVKWFAGILTVVLIGVISFSLFQVSLYSNFLRAIRYGGGSAVTLNCATKSNCPNDEDSYLFLTTSEVYIIYRKSIGSFFEIPKNKVNNIEYKTKADFALPI